jgi:HEAT repeat protein
MMPAEPASASIRVRRIASVAAVIAVVALFARTDGARAAWTPIAQFLSLQGPPAPASANVLSEHEVDVLDEMRPQNQAVLLLERSVNHYQGANEQIARRVSRWRGHLTLEGRLNELFITALNSDDLRVRAAAIEVDLAARNIEKSAEAVDRLEPIARFGEQGPRVNALWDLALVGNRGVETARVEQILLTSLHDPNQNIRYWTIEGLAYLGTDAAIEPLLEAFHDDPSPLIRERAACGLAQSGMLNDAQRRRAIPRLLDYAGDGGLDAETRKWVFQALRDITGQTLPHDASAWRAWYGKSGQAERFQ